MCDLETFLMRARLLRTLAGSGHMTERVLVHANAPGSREVREDFRPYVLINIH